MKNDLLALLRDKKIVSLLKFYKVRKIALFGSRANGKPRFDSDVDLLVDFKVDADLLDQAGLKIEMENLLKMKVDLVTPKALSRHFRAKVLREALFL
ncbi:MAG: nucleotidyltransferase domain-containing protein [Candidatus Omnitrophica bacterium]|nr:nucleotidyltransferase domain-containing protein [Candidatus Omnitrophota bacterium]